MNLKNTLFLATLTLFFLSCSNDSTDDLTEVIPVDQTVKFSDVKSIMDNNCNNCHGNPTTNGAPISLVTYDNVKTAIEQHGLIERMSIENGGDGLMPQGGPRLPQATIDVVIKWQTDGFQQ
ncbi:c-type cytochrome [Flavobacterium soli]|uniref:c-type cytochrome n=1 Tax=Flavobacterium soli TaxID=344881 RepID=UPI0005574730|nr:cytochrome c [Flavobacterium soli]